MLENNNNTMSFTDFEMTKTLTDVLQDGLYHINIPNIAATTAILNKTIMTVFY